MKNFVKPLELKQRLDESLGLNQSPMLSSRQMDWNGILVEQCKHSSTSFGAGKPTDKIIEEKTDMWAFAAHWTGLDVKPKLF
jgi:hypothetical protein